MAAKNHQRAWTKEADEKLLLYAGINSFKSIAKQLGRSPYAIERRLERLGFRNTKAGGLHSARELCLALNVDYKVVYRWKDKFGLPLQAMELAHVYERKKQTWFIDASEFWVWADKHRDLINFARIEPLTLLPEPPWLEEERRRCDAKFKSLWTEQEDDKLWELFYRQGMPQKEISQIMGRTVNSVGGRLARLRKNRLIQK